MRGMSHDEILTIGFGGRSVTADTSVRVYPLSSLKLLSVRLVTLMFSR